MIREEIEKITVDYALKHGGIVEWGIIDFAVEVYNLALDEAADLIDGVGKAEHNDAEKIRSLKI